MPIINYVCTDCEKEYEIFYKTQSERELEEAETPCPQCGSVNKTKQISKNTGFILKGRGWAHDNYS